MGKVIIGMTMSLDGFIADRSGSVASLYPDFEAMRESEVLQEAISDTGAVVMGRRAFEMGDPDSYADTYEFQVPIFVLTHHPPQKQPRETEKLTFTFVGDGIESAIKRAQDAAGNKDVTIVGGASTFQQCLYAGLADEIHIDIMPVLLCGGLPLFERLGTEPIALEKISVTESSTRTHLKFRVVK
jgi:dihydrofolate reductase